MWNKSILILMFTVLFFSCSKGGGPSEDSDGGIAPAVQVILGSSKSCALRDEKIKCWGNVPMVEKSEEENSEGEMKAETVIQDGSKASKIGDELPFIKLGKERTVKQLTIGNLHSCALLDNGRVKCWGGNASGQLGLGIKSDMEPDANDMGESLPYVDLGSKEESGEKDESDDEVASAEVAATDTEGGSDDKEVSTSHLEVKKIVTGPSSFHTCVILENDKVKCWGLGSKGQLGLGKNNNRGRKDWQMGDKLPYVKLGEDKNGLEYSAKKIAVGDYHTCVILKEDNKVKCWGSNEYGQLGLVSENIGDNWKEMGEYLKALDFGDDLYAIDLSLGFDKSCALLNDQSVKCWGGIRPDNNTKIDYFWGYLGQDPSGEILLKDRAPINLGEEVKVKQIAVGHTHICALIEDSKQIKCWGSNDNGELGQGNMEPTKNDFKQMGDELPKLNLGNGRSVQQISLGYKHSCAVLNDNQIKCWGDNKFGKLGLGDSKDRGVEKGQMGDNLPNVDLGSWPSD